MMKTIVIDIEFKSGEISHFEINEDGLFHFNAFPTLSENDPVVGIDVHKGERKMADKK